MTIFRVGILVNHFNPQVGGAHNFVEAVASALPFGTTENESLELVLLIENLGKDSYAGVANNVKRSKWIEARLLDAYRFSAGRIVFRLLERFNSIDKVVRRNNLDFLFFLGSSPVPTRVPFGVIVWDVQHRTHPWFPELQPGWTSRDELCRLVLPRASIVITGTNVGREQLINLYGVHGHNISVIPHPVPSDIPGASEKKYCRDFKFLYPAQFWPHKNHAVIIEAMNILRLQNKLSFKVIFVGSDKGNLSYIRELIGEYNLSEFCEIKGFVPRAELINLYQEVDALVYSSFSGPENLPPLEAFKSSVPVLYADIDGAREQLGKAALYFNPTSEKDLAEKFLKIVEDSKLRESLISEGKLQIIGRSNLDFAKQMLQLLVSFSLFRRAWK